MTGARWRALGGVAGPVAFVAAWALLGHRHAGYSPVDDPISRLAAVGAATRAPMTAGFLTFGVGVGLASAEMARSIGRAPGAAAAATALATFGIAATPLDSPLGGAAHAACAAAAYTSLAMLPIAGRRHWGGRGAALSVATGLAAGALLAASSFTDARTGLLQRAGLTVGDAWIVATSVSLARRRSTRR